MTEPFELTACDAVALIKARKLSAVELVESCLSRIATLEADLHAWTVVDEEAALARARELDHGRIAGEMFGVPLGVKDVIETVDLPTAYGCPEIYDRGQPQADAACVVLARAAGAVVVGKTVTQALACGAAVPTANPRNLNHTTGGSSSGSAAAVASKMVPVAFGTQSASSVIRPASYTGLVGMRPSMGLISVAGFKYFNGSFDTIGLLARDVDDVELLWAVQAGVTFERGRLPPRRPRVAVCYPPWLDRGQIASRQAIDKAQRQLGLAGAELKELVLPESYLKLLEAHFEIQAFEAARSYAYEAERHWCRLDGRVRALIEQGRSLHFERYLELMKLAQRARMEFERVLGDADFILTSAAPGEAPEGARVLGDRFEDMGDTSHSRVWTLLHVPAVTIPCDSGPSELPVGVQLIGAYGSDLDLLHHARRVEGLLGGPDRLETPIEPSGA